ncbi:CIR N-terminal domain-containing protein [Nonomuraea solani]|nr:CIR N-terminal domain-containing protein [Nonomuraea solani]
MVAATRTNQAKVERDQQRADLERRQRDELRQQADPTRSAATLLELEALQARLRQEGYAGANALSFTETRKVGTGEVAAASVHKVTCKLKTVPGPAKLGFNLQFTIAPDTLASHVEKLGQAEVVHDSFPARRRARPCTCTTESERGPLPPGTPPSKPSPDLAQEAPRAGGGDGRPERMDTALPGLADDGHADLVRDSLVTLLTIMRPDWGTRQAVAGRVRFAENRMKLTLPQLRLQAVTAAVTPNAPPDAFIRTTPADALRLADPEHTSKAIAQLRRQLHETSTTCPASPPAPSQASGEGAPRDAAEQVAADRAMLAQAMAVARRRQDRQAWTARQRTGEHAPDVPHALEGFAIADPAGRESDEAATPDDEW